MRNDDYLDLYLSIYNKYWIHSALCWWLILFPFLWFKTEKSRPPLWLWRKFSSFVLMSSRLGDNVLYILYPGWCFMLWLIYWNYTITPHHHLLLSTQSFSWNDSNIKLTLSSDNNVQKTINNQQADHYPRLQLRQQIEKFHSRPLWSWLPLEPPEVSRHWIIRLNFNLQLSKFPKIFYPVLQLFRIRKSVKYMVIRCKYIRNVFIKIMIDIWVLAMESIHKQKHFYYLSIYSSLPWALWSLTWKTIWMINFPHWSARACCPAPVWQDWRTHDDDHDSGLIVKC